MFQKSGKTDRQLGAGILLPLPHGQYDRKVSLSIVVKKMLANSLKLLAF